jgi:hypothetical protein
MKYYLNLGTVAVMAAILFQPVLVQRISAAEPIVVFLTDPEDQPEPTTAPVEIPEDEPSAEPTPATPTTPTVKKKKSLDDLIQETKLEPLSKKQERIVKSIQQDQREFIQLLGEFLVAKFDPQDDEVQPEFKKIRDQIVKLTFRSPDEKIYYERLYLINTSWLENQSEALRFASLDSHLQDKWQEIDEHRRKIQSMVMTGSAIVGAAIGGFLSYKASTKIFAMSADTKTFEKLAKIGGRIPIVLFGAYVGATAGRYVGFLGTDYLLGRQRDFLNPIDGTESLIDVLDEIERLP